MAGMQATQTAPATRIRARGRAQLSRGVRRFALTAHVVVSVGWLGLDLGLLTLGLTGLLSGDPQLQRAAYRAMGVFGDVLIIPISLASLLTGVLLSVGTTWGLFRYYWVAAKFWLTLAATTASIFALRAQLHAAVRQLPADPGGPVDIGGTAQSLVAAPTVALLVYLAATALSTYKPWGRTAAGKRARTGRR
jgi:hypothetical protein